MFGRFLAQTGSTEDRILTAADHFKNPSFDTGQIMLFAGLFALVVVCIMLAKFVYKYRMSKAVYVPAGNVTEADRVRHIVDLCILRRSKFEFKIIGRNTGGQIVSGMPVELKPNGVVMTMSILFAANQAKLVGEKIHCYFKIPIEGKDAFYNFLSEITAARQGQQGFLELTISMPDALVAGQKRHFLRITPPDDFVLEMSIWPEYESNSTQWQTMIEEFPEPLLHVLDSGDKTIDLKDISAGGARFNLFKKDVVDPRLTIAKGGRLMLKINLWDPVEQREVPLWLICRIQKYLDPAGSPTVELGVQFVAWAQPNKQAPAELQWFTLDSDDDEVPPLGNWVAKRYLEHYRKALVD